MHEKLHQNRIVVVGRNARDAHEYAQHERFRDSLESPVLVNSASHRLTISGGLAGMHVAAIYITERAPEGENYATVVEVLQRIVAKNPNVVWHEEPRRVQA